MGTPTFQKTMSSGEGRCQRHGEEKKKNCNHGGVEVQRAAEYSNQVERRWLQSPDPLGDVEEGATRSHTPSPTGPEQPISPRAVPCCFVH